MRFFLIFLSFLACTGYALSPVVAADDADEVADTSDGEESASSDDSTDDSASDDPDAGDKSDDAADGDKSDNANDAKDEDSDDDADADKNKDDAKSDDESDDEDDGDDSDKDDAKVKNDTKDSKGILDSKKSKDKKSDKTKKDKKDKSDKKSDAMPFAKKLAICPRGLEDKDIREVFKGFSYEGFEKVSSDGDYDLNNGMMRKPWGFYKGLDKRQYAVYAFKPDPENVVNVIDKDKLEAFKMLRIKIPEYCALYTEATPDEAGSDKHEPIGLLISRASLYKPRPVDPGSAKTEAVRMLIKSGVSPKDTGPSSDKLADKKSSKKKSGEDDEENILKRSKSGKKDSLVDTSEAKIFQKLTDNEEDDESDDADAKDDDASEKAKPDKKTLDGNVAGDSKEDASDDEDSASDEGDDSSAGDSEDADAEGDDASEGDDAGDDESDA